MNIITEAAIRLKQHLQHNHDSKAWWSIIVVKQTAAEFVPKDQYKTI